MAAMKPPPLWLWALIAFTENTGDNDGNDYDDDDDDYDDKYDYDDDNYDDEKFMIMRTKVTKPSIGNGTGSWISMQRLPKFPLG